MTIRLGEVNFDQVEQPSKPSSIIKVPTDANTPLVCKLVIDPRRPKDAYYPVYYHKHLVGPNQKTDNRNHLCFKTFSENCPECDYYWDLVSQLQELKKSNQAFVKNDKGEDVPTKAYEEIRNSMKSFRQSVRYWFLVIPAGETKPKAIMLTQEVVDKLFGRKEEGTPGSKYYKSAVTGLYYQMKDRGRSPYDLNLESGWVKIWRSGEAPRVTYHVEEHMIEGVIETKDGSKVTALQPAKIKIPESVLNLNADEIVDVTGIDKNDPQKNWTLEESANFVAGEGNKDAIPARCRKNSSGSSDEGSLLGTLDEAPVGAQASVENKPAPPREVPAEAPAPAVEAVTAQPVEAKAEPTPAPEPAKKAAGAENDGLDGLF